MLAGSHHAWIWGSEELPDNILATGASSSYMLEWSGHVPYQMAQGQGELLWQTQNLSTAKNNLKITKWDE